VPDPEVSRSCMIGSLLDFSRARYAQIDDMPHVLCLACCVWTSFTHRRTT
jgi:hypothetical protein